LLVKRETGYLRKDALVDSNLNGHAIKEKRNLLLQNNYPCVGNHITHLCINVDCTNHKGGTTSGLCT